MPQQEVYYVHDINNNYFKYFENIPKSEYATHSNLIKPSTVMIETPQFGPKSQATPFFDYNSAEEIKNILFNKFKLSCYVTPEVIDIQEETNNNDNVSRNSVFKNYHSGDKKIIENESVSYTNKNEQKERFVDSNVFNDLERLLKSSCSLLREMASFKNNLMKDFEELFQKQYKEIEEKTKAIEDLVKSLEGKKYIISSPKPALIQNSFEQAYKFSRDCKFEKKKHTLKEWIFYFRNDIINHSFKTDYFSNGYIRTVVNLDLNGICVYDYLDGQFKKSNKLNIDDKVKYSLNK